MTVRSRLVAPLVAVLLLTGCSDDPGTGPLPQGGHYELVDDLCEHVSLDAIIEVLPVVAEEMAVLDNPVPNARNCFGTLGLSDNPDEQGGFNILLGVFETDAEAAEYFDQFYDATSGDASHADIEGIGQRAYQYTVPITGSHPTVRVLDGNATLDCDWTTLVDLETPDGLVEACIETLRGTMASLQAG